jgi:hypothetical protein
MRPRRHASRGAARAERGDRQQRVEHARAVWTRAPRARGHARAGGARRTKRGERWKQGRAHAERRAHLVDPSPRRPPSERGLRGSRAAFCRGAAHDARW